MKHYPSLLFLLFAPALAFAQNERKGVYGSLGVGYGTYSLDLYDYAGGRNLYNEQTFSGAHLLLGLEKKSAWQKNKLVFDVGGGLMGGAGIKSDSRSSGNISGESKDGYMLGVKGLFKMGYLLRENDAAVVPLIGVGPYFNYIDTGGDEGEGNYIYGIQASLGVDFRLKWVMLTPEIHFGLASWGASDEMGQNGQPGMFEIKLKIAKQFR